MTSTLESVVYVNANSTAKERKDAAAAIDKAVAKKQAQAQ